MLLQHNYLNSSLLLLFFLCLCSCQHIDTGEDDSTEATSSDSKGKVPVTFTIADIDLIPFESTTSKSVAVSKLCTRFSVALFQDGSKVKTVNQSTDSNPSDFGQLTMSLTPGEYQLVAIAHNGLGNCSIASTDKVTFLNNKLTDTFYYYGTINVMEATTQQLSLSRPVSMFRLVLTDAIPSNVVQMKFYYTGGSSTFNAVSGFGCVNSRQTETFSIDASDYGKSSVFEVYTFPHEANDFLEMKITALDANGATVAEQMMENITIQPNVITQHTGTFFETTPSTAEGTVSLNQSFVIIDDGKWNSILDQ